MKHVLKTLKKYCLQIILVFILLFMQAMCDLSLPEYTSDIVNIGIQQSGIESSALDVIRESEYEKLLLFVNDEDKEIINNNYTLITKDDSEYLEKYPLLNEENLYILTGKDNLNEIMTFPIIMVYSFSNNTI